MCCNALSLFPPDAFRISHRFLPASICCICFVTARSFLRRVPCDNAELSLPLFLHIRSNKVFLVQLYPCSKCTSRTFSASHDVLCNNYLLTLLFTAFKFFPSCQLINAIATIRLANIRICMELSVFTQMQKLAAPRKCKSIFAFLAAMAAANECMFQKIVCVSLHDLTSFPAIKQLIFQKPHGQKCHCDC